MRVLCLCLALVLATGAFAELLSEQAYQDHFVDFVRDFDKSYSTNELFTRFAIFKSNYDAMIKHNAANLSWTQGINQFSDLTNKEFALFYLSGLRVPDAYAPQIVDEPADDVSNDIDWRQSGAVTPIKNQLQCGSCWAFSSTGVIEGWAKIKKSVPLNSLSEQQLVDCSGSAGNVGCNGGWPSAAIKYLATTGGACAQAAYPYTGVDGTCKRTCKPVQTVTGARTGSGESTLVKELNSFPVSIAVDAQQGFQQYKGGVFSGPCGHALNHAVLAVGYTSQYFIVKNSWGSTWGANGYIHMARNHNLCGLSNVLAWIA